MCAYIYVYMYMYIYSSRCPRSPKGRGHWLQSIDKGECWWGLEPRLIFYAVVVTL